MQAIPAASFARETIGCSTWHGQESNSSSYGSQDTCSYRNFFQVIGWLLVQAIPAASFARGTFGRSGIGRTFWHGQKIKQFPEFLIFHLCLVLLPWRHRTSLAMCVNEVCLFLSTRNPKPSLRLQCLVDTALAMCVPRLCLFSLSRSLCVSVSLSRRPPWSRFCLAWPRQHTIFLFSRVSVDRSCYSAPGDVVHPGAMSIQSLDPQTVSVVFSVTLLLSPCLPSTKLGRSRPSRRPVCWSNFFLCDSLSLFLSPSLCLSLRTRLPWPSQGPGNVCWKTCSP